MQRIEEKKLPLLNAKDVTSQSAIGSGRCSIVYKGLFNNKPVAIKVARPGERKALEQEMQVINYLIPDSKEEKKSAENIMPYHGYTAKLKTKTYNGIKQVSK